MDYSLFEAVVPASKAKFPNLQHSASRPPKPSNHDQRCCGTYPATPQLITNPCDSSRYVLPQQASRDTVRQVRTVLVYPRQDHLLTFSFLSSFSPSSRYTVDQKYLVPLNLTSNNNHVRLLQGDYPGSGPNGLPPLPLHHSISR